MHKINKQIEASSINQQVFVHIKIYKATITPIENLISHFKAQGCKLKAVLAKYPKLQHQND